MRVPGASVAAAAEAAAAARAAAAALAPGPPRQPAGTQAAARGGAGTTSETAAAAGGGTQPLVGGTTGVTVVAAAAADDGDAEFVTVESRRARRLRARADLGQPPESQGQPGAADAMEVDGAEAARAPPPQAGEPPGGGGDAGEEDDEVDDGPEDVAVLKARWEKEAATVRVLEKEGILAAHPTMQAAVAARDAAERAYRLQRSPHPIGRRMGWAQARLDKAFRKLERTRAELAEFDKEVQERRQRFVDRLDADRQRVDKHRDEVEALQLEAGADIYGADREPAGSKQVCQRAAGGLRQAAPRAVALAESLPEGSQAREEANLLLAHLSKLQQELDAAAGQNVPESFTIGDDGSGSEWSESHDLGASDGAGRSGGERGATDSGQPGWRASGHGRWQKGAGPHGAASKGGGKGALVYSAAGGPVAAPGPLGPAGAASSAAGGLQPGEGTSAQQQPQRLPQQPSPAAGAAGGGGAEAGNGTPAGQGAAAETDNDGPPAAKHGKGQQSSDSDEVAAAALYQQQAAGAAAGFNTPSGIKLAAQQHARHVAEVVNLATEQGVQPLTDDGLDLIMLGPDELREWARSHLSGGSYW